MTTKAQRLSPEELTAIRERAERATPGPWKALDNWRGVMYKYVAAPGGVVTDGIAHHNAEFIAHAREDIPKLLAEIERLRTALEEINRAWYENSTDYDLAMKVRTILDRSGFRKGE